MKFESLFTDGKGPRISASLVKSYYDCPLGFKLTNIDGYWQEEGEALHFGSMWDEMFKAYHKKLDPYDAVKSKSKLWFSPPTQSQINRFALCRRLMERYKLNPIQFINPTFDVGFKIPFMNPITKEYLEYKISGYLDGVDRIAPPMMRIIEVKTASEFWTQEKANTEVQAKMYIYHSWWTNRILYPLDYYVFRKKDGERQHLEVRATFEDLANLFDYLKTFIENVRAEKFDPNPNHPRWCACIKARKEGFI